MSGQSSQNYTIVNSRVEIFNPGTVGQEDVKQTGVEANPAPNVVDVHCNLKFKQ